MRTEYDPKEQPVVDDVERSQTNLTPPAPQVTKKNEKLAELQQRLSSYEAEMRQLSQLLSTANYEVAQLRSVLHWILSSRSWKLTSWLRAAKFLGEKFRKSPSRHSALFVGDIESPTGDGRVSRLLEVSGWVHSSAGPVLSVEVFVDSVPLGVLEHGQPRPDISAYPAQVPINCGYSGRVLVDESFAGSRKLVVRVKDNRGNIRDYSRSLLVEEPLSPVVAPTLGTQYQKSFIAPLLRDDLSIAKRLQSSLGTISLTNLLISNSVLEFRRTEKPETSIILVLYNRAELTLQCLYSILQSNIDSYEVIIVDNASTDETRQLLSRVKGARIIPNEQNLHYVLACNQALKQANGEYLLLLNNDAQVDPHSISSALATLKSSDDIGAVGGRVILPDGNLQEAGSIIWQDGSCTGYDRGISPLDPTCMFRRDVDYCSAVFLLTRRDLFLAEGGFDEAFVPAYYEETDYCARLWQSGKRVVYDPDVSLVHYEFASSGSTESAIDLQAKHREIFVARHKDWLQHHYPHSAQNILAGRIHQRPGMKRILLLDDRVPHISSGSGFPRSNRIVRELVKMGHLVTCYPLTHPHEDWTTIYEDIPREVEVIINYGFPLIERFLSDRAGYYDVVFISRPHNMSNLNSMIRNQLFAGATIIYDAEALFSLRHIEQKRLQGKKVSSQERQRILDEEISLAEGCDRVISVSQQESQEFLKYGLKDVYTLGHALEVLPTPNDFAARKDILFVGAIHEPDSPNADSVLWFCRKILPKIQKALGAELNLIIVGLMHPDVEEQLDKKSTQVKGVVKDLTRLYDECRIFVAPTRFSAGLPLKVYEAAAYGLPVVATALTGSQLGWNHDEELLLAEDEESFAAACIRLYYYREVWHHLRQNALKRVATECSPESFAEQLKAVIG